jgi:hypothetical protein
MKKLFKITGASILLGIILYGVCATKSSTWDYTEMDELFKGFITFVWLASVMVIVMLTKIDKG